MVPNGLFGTIALLVWQPTNDKEVRRYGFAIAYLLTFLLVMVYLFHFHFRHAAPEP